MCDRESDGQMVRPPRAPGEQLNAELRPGIHAHDQTVVQDGQSRRLEHEPPHFGLHV